MKARLSQIQLHLATWGQQCGLHTHITTCVYLFHCYVHMRSIIVVHVCMYIYVYIQQNEQLTLFAKHIIIMIEENVRNLQLFQ